MNATPQRVQSDEPVIEPLGPGPRLRAARERLEMSLAEVGERLHLHVSTVEALEANAYGELPAPTFVRGYLRSYAQLVGLAPEPVVDEFDSQGLAPPALVADISEGPQARTTDLPMRLATWGILAALVVLVVMWWNSQTSGVDVSAGAAEEVVADAGGPSAASASGPAGETGAPEAGTERAGTQQAGTEEQTGTEQAGTVHTGAARTETSQTGTVQAPSPAAAGIRADAAAVDTAVEPEAAVDAAPSALFGAADETSAPASPPDARAGIDEAAVQGPAPVAAGERAGGPEIPAASAATPAAATGAMAGLDLEPPAALGSSAAPAGSEERARPASELAGADELDTGDPGPDAGSLALALAPTTTDPATQAFTDSSIPASAGEERLVLRFAAESWVEIYDRDEQRLYFNLVEPDGVIDVAGPGPLRVLLGRAEGVVAAHNGAALDITPYISRGGIARFTVGDSSTAR